MRQLRKGLATKSVTEMAVTSRHDRRATSQCRHHQLVTCLQSQCLRSFYVLLVIFQHQNMSLKVNWWWSERERLWITIDIAIDSCLGLEVVVIEFLVPNFNVCDTYYVHVHGTYVMWRTCTCTFFSVSQVIILYFFTHQRWGTTTKHDAFWYWVLSIIATWLYVY